MIYVLSFSRLLSGRKHAEHFTHRSKLGAELTFRGGTDITQEAIVPFFSWTDADIFATVL